MKQASPHGRNPLHPTGETHFALGVKQASPKPSKEPSIEPSRESTRAKKPKTNPKPKTKPKTTPATDPRQTLVDFQPDQSHIALADAFGLDLDYELAKFRDALAANGRYPADPAPAFRNWLRRGSNATIVASGIMVSEAIEAASLLSEEGIDVGVIDIHTIKPIDEEILVEAAGIGPVVTAEEHSVIGGLGGAVAEVLSRRCPVRMDMVGQHDTFGESGKPQELKEKYKMTAADIAQAVKRIL